MVVRIPLTKGQVALVDDEHAHLVECHKWMCNSNGYASRYSTKNGKPCSLLMHRYLYECLVGEIPEKWQIDHIDGNRLNNQIANLRTVTNRANAHNRAVRREGKTSSKYVGVYWSKGERKWKAHIDIEGRRTGLGTYTDEYEAHLAYQSALQKIKEQHS